MSDNNIHVVLTLYDPKGTYSQHAGVTITSIFENTKSKVTVHILHDDTLSELNRERFLNTAKKFNQTIDLINIEDYKNNLNKEILDRIPEAWTIATLYRFFIPELLPELDKIIYLDSDIVVKLDIAELWNIDMEDNCLCAARDVLSYDEFTKTLPHYMTFRFKLLKIPVEKYVNSGVMLMSLNKIRERGNLLNNYINWMQRNAHAVVGVNQEAFNAIFIDSIKIIDQKFCYFNYLKEDIDLSGHIIHYIGGPKPWSVFPFNKADRLYWSTLFKSEWLSSCNGGGGGVFKFVGRAKAQRSYGQFFKAHRSRTQRQALSRAYKAVLDECCLQHPELCYI